MYDDVDGHASRAELEKDPRLILSSSLIVTTEALKISFVGIDDLVIGVQGVRVKLAVSSEATNSHFDFPVTEHALMAFDSEESSEQNLEPSNWYSVVCEDVDEHASLAELEVDSAAVFCPCLVEAAQALEVGLVGVEALPVAVGTHRIVH